MVLFVLGINHPQGQGSRLRPISAQGTVLVHQGATVRQDVHDSRRQGFRGAVLQAHHHWCSGRLEESNTECLRPGKEIGNTVNSKLTEIGLTALQINSDKE